MFKSAKSIQVESIRFKSMRSVMVAPNLNILGIELSATTPIPKELVDFLSSKGAKIDLIEEDGDKLIRVTGIFDITHEEVQKFFKDQSALRKRDASGSESKSLEESKTAVDAVNFQRQVAARFKALQSSMAPHMQIKHVFCEVSQIVVETSDGLAVYKNNTPLFALTRSDISAGTSNKIEAGESVSIGGSSIRSGKGTTIVAGEDSSIGEAPDESTNSGFLAEITTVGRLSIKSGAANKVQNAVVMSGGPVVMAAGTTVEIAYQHDAYWANPPLIPSFVFAYDPVVATSTSAPVSSSISSISSSSSRTCK